MRGGTSRLTTTQLAGQSLTMTPQFTAGCLSVCPAASAVLSESVNVHFTGPSRSGHVKVGSDTWARANVWAEAKRRVRGL